MTFIVRRALVSAETPLHPLVLRLFALAPLLVSAIHVDTRRVQREDAHWEMDQSHMGSQSQYPFIEAQSPYMDPVAPEVVPPADGMISSVTPRGATELQVPIMQALNAGQPPRSQLLPLPPTAQTPQLQVAPTASLTFAPSPWTQVLDPTLPKERQQRGEGQPDTIFPQSFLAPSNISWSAANSQADVAKIQRDALERAAAKLEGEAKTANEAAEDAKLRERELWDKSRVATSARRDEETRQAVTSARWNTEIGFMEDTLDGLLKSAKRETDDRLAAEEIVKQLQADKLLQAVGAAEALGGEGKADAYAAGAEAQRNADAPQLVSMGQALKDITAAATAGYAAQAKMNKLALEAGKKIGTMARDYQKASPVAQAVRTALAEAALSGEALKAQELAAAGSGIVVKELPNVVN